MDYTSTTDESSDCYIPRTAGLWSRTYRCGHATESSQVQTLST